MKKLLLLFAFFIVYFESESAELFSKPNPAGDTAVNTKKKVSFRDSLDGAFDVSDFLITVHGFIPVPTLVTEPALGGIGGALGLVFMQPPKHFVPSEKQKTPPRPTIAGAGGMYTANNSWAAGGFYTSEWAKYGIIYTAASAYADINMNFYRTLPLTEKEVHALFNFKSIPVYVAARKTIGERFSAGLKYMFIKTDVSLAKGDTLDGHTFFNQLLEKLENKTQVSRISPTFTFDSRDNMFSPNNGIRIDAQMDWSNKALGSDFNFIQTGVEAYGYKTFLKPWVASLRLEWEQMFQDAAFYMLPAISLRGVPANRYQGSITALAETEHRVNIYKRWAVVGFAGLAKAFDTYPGFSDADWIYNYGGGIRYLIARKFKLQMGVDVGFGPDSWGVYIVFGSGWLRD